MLRTQTNILLLVVAGLAFSLLAWMIWADFAPHALAGQGESGTTGPARPAAENVFAQPGPPDKTTAPAARSAVPLGGGPDPDEQLGGCNPSELSTTTSCGQPVNVRTGNFWHTFSDLAVPGRGPALYFARTYNSWRKTERETVGYGWTHNYNMFIRQEGMGALHRWVVVQENSSEAPFFDPDTADPNYYPPTPWVRGELRKYPATDTFIFTRTHGLTRFHFQDIAGTYRLTKIVDRNSYTTTLAYTTTAPGLLRTVTDPAGRTLFFAYQLINGQQLLDHVTDTTSNRSVSFGYSSSHDLTSATDVAGQATTFTYNSHRLETMTDPNQGVLQNVYDTADTRRIARQEDPLHRILSFQYICDGFACLTPTTVVTASLWTNSDTPSINTITQEVTVYTHTLYSLLSYVVENYRTPQQATWHFNWITHDGIGAVTDPNNHTWNYTWDSQNNLLSSTDPLGYQTRFAYNSTNDLLVMTNAVGIPITFTYDISGNLQTVARPLTQTNQILTTTLGYDPARPGDVVSITNPLGNSWRYGYDAYGYVVSSTNPLAETARFTYDTIGRLLSAASPQAYTSTFTYTTYGAPTRITDTLGYTTVYTYDANRNLKVITDTKGFTTTYAYNLNNEVTRVTHMDGTHSDYGYDGFGNVISQSNGLGQTTTYEYDGFNRLITVTTPLTVSAVYSYDRAGNLRVMTNAQGLTTTFGYNNADQLISLTYDSRGTPSTPNVGFAYDPRGFRTVMTDGTGSTLYTYDSLNRLTKVQQGGGQTVRYGYDLGSRLTELGYPNLGGTGIVTATREYNTANRFIRLTDWASRQFNFYYDPDGNLTEMTYPNGVGAAYGYDRAGQVLTMTYTLTPTLVFSATYTRDPVGLVGTGRDGGTSTDIHNYEYDTLHRLRGDAISGGSTVSNTWTLDAATEITATYRQVGIGVATGGVRTYNAGNQLLSVVEQQGGPPTTTDLSFTYSTTGNRLTRYDKLTKGTTTYQYDQANRLVDYNFVKFYSYNGDGLRMTKTGWGIGMDNYVWDVGAGLPLLLQDSTASYLYGPGGLLLEEIDGGGTAYYYHADQLGSIRALTDGSGAVVNSYSYDAYGQPTASETVYNPFGYAGEYTDSESGLIYLRARYYDPATQQFLTLDPIVALTGQAYNYVGGNPTNLIDPLGLRPADPDDYISPRKRSKLFVGLPVSANPYIRSQQIMAQGYMDLGQAAGEGIGNSCRAIGTFIEDYLNFTAEFLSDPEYVFGLIDTYGFKEDMTDAVRSRFGRQADYWEFEGLNGKIEKLVNPDPRLPGNNQVRIYARFVDQVNDEVQDLSINYDPDNHLFGDIHYSSGKR